METLSRENKERVLRMILKLKKKRKPVRVMPMLEIDGQSSAMFPTNVEQLDYRAESGKIRQQLREIIENS